MRLRFVRRKRLLTPDESKVAKILNALGVPFQHESIVLVGSSTAAKQDHNPPTAIPDFQIFHWIQGIIFFLEVKRKLGKRGRHQQELAMAAGYGLGYVFVGRYQREETLEQEVLRGIEEGIETFFKARTYPGWEEAAQRTLEVVIGSKPDLRRQNRIYVELLEVA